MTRWAYVTVRSDVRSKPDGVSKVVTKLRYSTEDGWPEVYIVLSSFQDPAGKIWVKIRIPGRPNGRIGWVPRDSLGEFHLSDNYLEIRKRSYRAVLYKGKKKIWSARIAHGASSSPTPAGRFWVRERLRNLGGNPLYGPWAFGTAAYSKLSDWPGGGVVGIHGTNQPELIPGRPSHGCIRVRNDKVRKLAKLLKVGTPIHVRR